MVNKLVISYGNRQARLVRFVFEDFHGGEETSALAVRIDLASSFGFFPVAISESKKGRIRIY
jgi:hypothetical protein